MNLRVATTDDYLELVGMYRELLAVTYEDMQLGKDIFMYGAVIEWFKQNKDIVICEKEDGIITGFTVAYLQDTGVVEPYYYGDIAYVKPEFRKGRSAYLLYNNGVNYAKKEGLPIIAKAYVGGGNKESVDRIQGRWGHPVFTEYSTGSIKKDS